MNKAKLTFILVVFTIIPLAHGCFSTWNSESQCYECTNCTSPFDQSSPQVTKDTCGTLSSGCRVGFFLFNLFIT
jgi:phage-related protein